MDSVCNSSIDSVSNSSDSPEWRPLETLLVDGMEKFLDPTEYVAVQVHDVVLVNTNVAGTLLVTNFRLLFASKAPRELVPLGTIPLATIDKFSKQYARATLADKENRTVPRRLLQVAGKDMRILVYAFNPGTKQRKQIFDQLTRRLRASRLLDLYAFICGPSMVRNTNANIRLLHEYFRLLGTKDNLIQSRKSNKWWRISDVNSKYTVCPTYPFCFIVPVGISDEEILQAASFRALGRLPVIIWCHPENGAVLARSSQPSVGMMNSRRSIPDEKLVAALCASQRSSSTNTKLVYIADARPWKSALVNGAMGKGTESSSNYSQAEVVFLGIDNVHAMRESFSRLRDYLDTHGIASSDGLLSFNREGGWNWGGGNVSVSALGNSNWVTHIHSILAGSAWIAARIALQGAPVLVHCSDGWDRTTQLVSLAGLLLDPYYRTFDGFQALVEKDWLAFGHPFAHRLGMPTLDAKLNTAPAANAPAISSNNYSPIFLQWVDCVAQILRMYPRAFEFSSAYLVEIVDCVLSGRFGNFLCNTEKERLEAGVADSCGCMWLYLAQLRSSSHGRSNIHEHCNIFYSPDEHPEPLLPPAAAFSPTLWSHFHLRWASPSDARVGSEIEAQCRVMELNFMELQEANEIAEKKIKDMETSLQALTEQLTSEKSARRSAVAVATRALRENKFIKRAVESVGYNVNFSGSSHSMYTDIASSEDLEEKIMGLSTVELSVMKDVDEVKEQEDLEDDLSLSISVSAE